MHSAPRLHTKSVNEQNENQVKQLPLKKLLSKAAGFHCKNNDKNFCVLAQEKLMPEKNKGKYAKNH